MFPKKTIALERARKERYMTKADLSRATGMQQSVIGWIESGRFIPYDSQLKKIADALNWDKDVQELLKEVEN